MPQREREREKEKERVLQVARVFAILKIQYLSK